MSSEDLPSPKLFPQFSGSTSQSHRQQYWCALKVMQEGKFTMGMINLTDRELFLTMRALFHIDKYMNITDVF